MKLSQPLEYMDTLSFPRASFGDFEDVYPPAEDTFILLDALESDLESLTRTVSICIECGSGSGAVITSLAKAIGSSNRLMIALDINRSACLMTKKCKQYYLQDRIEVLQSDLTSPFIGTLDGKVDLLIFNPPYVPTESEELEQARVRSSNQIPLSWAGGQDGRVIIDQFLNQVPRLLSKPDGAVYLVVLNRNSVDSLIGYFSDSLGLKGKVVESRRAGIESLFVIKYNWIR